MHRFALSQPDLFTPATPASPPATPARPPLDELAELLAALRSAERLPWPDVVSAMAAEYRVLWLARRAGAEGEMVAASIMEETERLFAAAEQEAARAATAPQRG